MTSSKNRNCLSRVQKKDFDVCFFVRRFFRIFTQYEMFPGVKILLGKPTIVSSFDSSLDLWGTGPAQNLILVFDFILYIKNILC